MLESLYIEAESWRNGVYVFAIEPFQYGRFASIVETSFTY